MAKIRGQLVYVLMMTACLPLNPRYLVKLMIFKCRSFQIVEEELDVTLMQAALTTHVALFHDMDNCFRPRNFHQIPITAVCLHSAVCHVLDLPNNTVRTTIIAANSRTMPRVPTISDSSITILHVSSGRKQAADFALKNEMYHHIQKHLDRSDNQQLEPVLALASNDNDYVDILKYSSYKKFKNVVLLTPKSRPKWMRSTKTLTHGSNIAKYADVAIALERGWPEYYEDNLLELYPSQDVSGAVWRIKDVIYN